MHVVIGESKKYKTVKPIAANKYPILILAKAALIAFISVVKNIINSKINIVIASPNIILFKILLKLYLFFSFLLIGKLYHKYIIVSTLCPFYGKLKAGFKNPLK